MVVKLTSGREIDIQPLNWKQRAEIKDMALKNYRDKIPVSLLTCGIAVQYACKVSDTDLNEWPDEDIYEAGAKVFESMQVPEADKKK